MHAHSDYKNEIKGVFNKGIDMATKKKKGKSKKRRQPKMKYSLKDLREMLKAIEMKSESGTPLDEREELLKVAIQQTIAISNTSSKLDLSSDSEGYLDEALMKKGLELQEEGLEEEQIINELASVAASYLLFEQINLLTSFKFVGDVYYDAEKPNDLLLKASIFLSPDKILFNVNEALSSVADKCFVFADISPAQMGIKNVGLDEIVRSIGVNLDPYRNLFSREVLEKL